MPKVLVVEDDAEIRELVVELLEADGYATAQASNGREALDYLAQERPCLVLLDLMMPVMSGPELLEAIAEDAALSTVPIVVVSAVADHGAVPGVKRFLRKPVTSETLRETVQEFCGGPGAAAI